MGIIAVVLIKVSTITGVQKATITPTQAKKDIRKEKSKSQKHSVTENLRQWQTS